jgi:MFS transporter, ACS family, hexuronate transporter
VPAFAQATVPTVRPIRNLRWWIGALLFASTVINYIDRQTLALLSPYLKQIYHWTNSDYANLLIGFRIAYSVGQTVCGRLMDRPKTTTIVSREAFGAWPHREVS